MPDRTFGRRSGFVRGVSLGFPRRERNTGPPPGALRPEKARRAMCFIQTPSRVLSGGGQGVAEAGTEVVIGQVRDPGISASWKDALVQFWWLQNGAAAVARNYRVERQTLP